MSDGGTPTDLVSTPSVASGSSTLKNIVSSTGKYSNEEVEALCRVLASSEAALRAAPSYSAEEVESLRITLLSHTVNEVKLLSKRFGVRLTGAGRKAEMVNRIIGMARIGALSLADENMGPEHTMNSLGLSYITPDIQETLKSLPPFSTVTSWMKELSPHLKEFTFMNLLVYLVYGRDKSFDMDSMRAYKSLKAYKFFFDGFVKNVWLHPFAETNPPIIYVRGFVHHSLSTDPPLEVFVSINADSGDVYGGQCNCVSGLGEACNHVAAILFFLEHHSGKDVLPSEVSKTSKPMEWNKPPKKVVEAARVQDIAFVKPAHGGPTAEDSNSQHSRASKEVRREEDCALHRQDLDKLLDDLRQGFPSSGVFQFWTKNPVPRSTSSSENVQTSLQDYIIFSHQRADEVDRDQFFKPSQEMCWQHMKEEFTVPREVVEMVEAKTRGQASSELWHLLHNGRLTSHRFGEILRRRESTDPSRLVKAIMGYGGGMKGLPPAIRWGRDNEPKARQLYIHDRKGKGEIMHVRDSGLTLLEEKSFLGASSDGIVTCANADLNVVGCLEVKCAFSVDGKSVVNLTPNEIADKFGKKFCLQKGDDGVLHLATDHQYYAQVQGELNILGLDWCDFVVYSGNAVVVDRIMRDVSFWEDKLLPTLEKFFAEHVLPEIWSGKLFSVCYPSSESFCSSAGQN